uniref:Uncharacterized protein n=1 Tax=Glossina pallidipes TaxID=7398 RepID=A0A1B0AK84_GLOPL
MIAWHHSTVGGFNQNNEINLSGRSQAQSGYCILMAFVLSSLCMTSIYHKLIQRLEYAKTSIQPEWSHTVGYYTKRDKINFTLNQNIYKTLHNTKENNENLWVEAWSRDLEESSLIE